MYPSAVVWNDSEICVLLKRDPHGPDCQFGYALNCYKIERYCQTLTYEQFIEDDKTKDAVIRNLEVIGEAANNIPDNIKKKFPDIAWRVITDMRNKLIHEYFGVSYPIVWETIQSDLPKGSSLIETLLLLMTDTRETSWFLPFILT